MTGVKQHAFKINTTQAKSFTLDDTSCSHQKHMADKHRKKQHDAEM